MTTKPIPASRPLVLLGLLALAVYGVFLGVHATPVACGSDASGYLNSARILASGRLQDELRLPAEFAADPATKRLHFMPLGFDLVVKGNPHLPPTYAPGLPLQLFLPGKLLGWPAGTIFVEMALALGGLWLCYAIGRECGLDPTLAMAAGAALAAFPVFLFTSIQPLSDTAAMTWCLAAMWAALRARRNALWAAGCGAALSMAVLVRMTDLLLLPALLVLLLPNWRRLLLAGVAGLPGAAWLMYYNHTLYGGAFRSGYGPAIWETFSRSFFSPTLSHFAYWLAVLLPTPFLVLPLVALWRARSRVLLALGLWFGAIAGFYLFYSVSRETWWCLRFILPAVPALLIAGAIGAQSLVPQKRWLPALVLTLWAVVASMYWSRRLAPLGMKQANAVYAEVTAQARATLPRDALIATLAASGAFYFYTDFPILRADLMERDEFARYAALAQKVGRPIYAALFIGYDDSLIAERMPGRWEKIATVRNVQLWHLIAADPPAATPTP